MTNEEFREACEDRLVSASYIVETFEFTNRVAYFRASKKGKLPAPVWVANRYALYDREEVDEWAANGAPEKLELA